MKELLAMVSAFDATRQHYRLLRCFRLSRLTISGNGVIGIDLGSPLTRVGIFRNNTFEIIADEHGRDSVPSCVAFPKHGPSLVGFAAMDQAVKNPKNTVCDAR